MDQQDDWDATLYATKHNFVPALAADLLDEVDDWSGKRVLDVGCGVGDLTDELRNRGANVIGIDSSASMIDAARQRFKETEFIVGDVRCLPFRETFDIVFSNAALHWVLEADRAAISLFEALGPKGKLLFEMGGHGNVATIRGALCSALWRQGHAANATKQPWYFPTIGEHASLLEASGFCVPKATLFDRPTTLEGENGMANWLRMFGQPYFEGLKPTEVDEVVSATSHALRATHFANGRWTADYVRLRMLAEKAAR